MPCLCVACVTLSMSEQLGSVYVCKFVGWWVELGGWGWLGGGEGLAAGGGGGGRGGQVIFSRNCTKPFLHESVHFLHKRVISLK